MEIIIGLIILFIIYIAIKGSASKKKSSRRNEVTLSVEVLETFIATFRLRLKSCVIKSERL